MNKTPSIINSVISPLLAILLLMLGNGFFQSFTSLRLSSLGHDEWIIGCVHSAFYMGMLIGAARAEAVINKVGHIRAYAGYAGIGTACLMLQALVADPAVWAVTRLIMGFCMAVYYIVVESWFLASATVQTRGTILAVYMISLYLSQAVSQFILNWIDLNTTEPFLVAALLGALSAVPLTLAKIEAPALHEGAAQSFWGLYRKSYFGFMGCLISGIILGAFYSFAPLFARVNDLPIASVVSCCIFGGVLLQWPVGKLSDVLDRRQVLFGVTLATAIQAMLFIFVSPSGVMLYGSLFLLGGLIFTLYPLSIAQVCDRVQPEELTSVTGLLLLTYGIGAVAGPLLAPFCVDAYPASGLFLFFLINASLLVLIGLHSFRIADAVPEELQTDFIPLPRSTAVAYELDPRSEEESLLGGEHDTASSS